jgi:gamma-glutamyltranspeptidase/glutathione hydrolase
MTDGGYVSLESQISAETRRELMKKGHVIRDIVGAYGGYQAIMYDSENKVYYGASETRKDGHAAGY